MQSRSVMRMGVVAVYALLCAGCGGSATGTGSSGTDVPSDGGGLLPERTAFSYLDNIVLTPVTVGSVQAEGYVDTGDPLTLMDPMVFTSLANIPATGANVPSVRIGSWTASNVLVIPGPSDGDPALPLAANIGCTSVCGLVLGFDYQGVALQIGSNLPAAPQGLEPEQVIDFTLAGGETIDGVTLPTSRIIVPVSLEGTDYPMILDTGASYVTVNAEAFAALTKDGRTQISMAGLQTTSGVSDASMTRARSVSVGGVSVASVVVAHDSSFDTNLAAIGMDAKQTVYGSLGGTFLHDFFVTVDYPNRKIHLARYSNLDWALDPGQRLDVSLEVTAGGYLAQSVGGDAAKQGLPQRDVIVAIDGVRLAGLGGAQVAALTFGKVGAVKQVTFGPLSSTANQTLDIAVDELLPLP